MFRAKQLVIAITLLSCILATIGLASAAPVHVKIYSGFTKTGGGTPYSNLVGTFDATAVDFGTTTNFAWHPFSQASFGADIKGSIQIPSDGSYLFKLNSDDGSMLYIDGNLVVDNGGVHGVASVSGSANLKAGIHPFEVQFFEDGNLTSGVDLTLPTGVSYVDFLQKYLDVTTIPDVNGDSVMDQAVLAMKVNKYYLRTIDSATGNELKHVILGAATDITPNALTSVGQQISVLITKSIGVSVLQLRDSETLALVKTLKLPK